MKTANKVVRSILIAAIALAPAAALPRAQAQASAVTAAQPGQPRSLLITIVEGEGALNDIRTRTAREPIVQVDDENHKPVAGALVLFSLDKTGSSYANFSGVSSLTVHTDAAGRAVANGFQITQHKGSYHINVHATYGELVADAIINQINIAPGGGGGGATQTAVAAVSHHKMIWIVGGALAGGAIATIVVATQQSSPTIVSPGTGTVGAPAAVGGVRFQLHTPHR